MIPSRAQRAHDLAEATGQNGYIDPDTGYFVMAANYLRRQGKCCGRGCRHCPWPGQEQRRAGRTEISNPDSS